MHIRVSAVSPSMAATAEREYRRRVLPGLPAAQQSIERIRLPSTSPAHAGMSLDAKLAAWRILLDHL